MKPQPIKKLFAFIVVVIFSFSILVFNSSCQKETNTDPMNPNVSASSKIVYTDLVPDTTIVTTHTQAISSYDLDLDNNNFKDFTLLAKWNSGTRCGAAECPTIGSFSLNIIMLDGNSALDSINCFSGSMVAPLNLNDII